MTELKAKPHCCEEASTMSHNFYIPCNQPAVSVVGWKGRSEQPIRMCEACEWHNIRNRRGVRIGPYFGPAVTPPSPPEPLESPKRDAKKAWLELRRRNPHLAVDHIDGNPCNNDPTNLRLVTIRENR